LNAGDVLIIHDVWGAIQYRGEGCFIAGGAGDIIYHAEFDEILDGNAVYVLTAEDSPSFPKGPIDQAFLQREIKDFTQPFYVCGPDQMVADLTKTLTELGANPETVVFER
jgi:ferredoxin-NADP reductase